MMVASGITQRFLPAGNEVVCTLRAPEVPACAAAMGTTRSAAALELWRPLLDGAVVAIGNAPTALFRLLEMIEEGAPRPAVVLGLPVGFVGAMESKAALVGAPGRARARRRPRPPRRFGDDGRRGQRARAAEAESAVTGRLYGVGVGPGDPSLMTVRAVDLVRGADVVAYHCARHGRSHARSIVAQYLGTQTEEQLTYPVTTEQTDDYQGRLDAFYAEAAARLAAHLDAGRDVVVIAEGDPFFYGSYMHLHKRLADRFPTEVVPGVTSVSAAAASLGRPLVERDEVLTVLPGTLPPDELAPASPTPTPPR